MAISFVGQTTTNTTTPSLPAGILTDDLIIVIAQNATNTALSNPTGYTQLFNNGTIQEGKTLVSSRIATGSDSIGTITAAGAITVLVYRGAFGTGALTNSGSSNSGTATIPALTLTQTGNTSWVLGVVTTRNTSTLTTPSGTTLRSTSAGTVNASGIFVDTAATVTSWSSTTSILGTSTGWQTVALEILGVNSVLTTQTQTGVSRISATTAKSQTGKANIQNTTQKTQTGVSNLNIKTTKTQTGVANIFVPTLVDSYSETNETSSFTVVSSGGNHAAGQTFTGNGNLSYSAKFYLEKSGTPTGPIFASIYAITGTFGSTAIPVGSALVSSNSIDASTLTTSFALYEFIFSSNIPFINGTHYAVVLDASGATGATGANRILVGQNASGSHAGNRVNFDDVITNAWAANATADICFYVYGISVTTTSHTQTGVANIKALTTKTQTGKARITVSDTKLQTGITRISKVVSHVQTGVANILHGATRTITGVANLRNSSTRGQTGKSRVSVVTARTISAKSRISVITTKTQTGKSRLTTKTVKTQLGISSIGANTLHTISGKSSLVIKTQRFQHGVSNIGSKTQKTQTGVSRIIFGFDMFTKPALAGVIPDNTVLNVVNGENGVSGIKLNI